MANTKGNKPQMTEAQKAAAAAKRAQEKSAKFVKLAKKRVPKALKAISLIGNLAGSGYSYTPEQVEKIKTALDNQVKQTLSSFAPGAKKAQAEFEI